MPQHPLDKHNKIYLSALVDADSFFYGLCDKDNKWQKLGTIKLKGLHEWNLREPQASQITKTTIGVLTNLFTLVPSTEWNPDQTGDFLNFAQYSNDAYDLEILADEISNFGIHLCYAFPVKRKQQLKSTFGAHGIVHLISALLRSVRKRDSIDFIHISRIGNKVIMICLRRGVPVLANMFRKASSSDLLYFTQLVVDRYELDEQILMIQCSGDYDDKRVEINLLRRYFKEVEYHSEDLSDTEVLSGIGNSKLIPLQSIISCA